ncbi:uncharacterized protein L3040_006854 [Drepanopeziza brunnea f. sp. 'multigermtubi']|uniref:uncharacterized protein n=1 Tax=Drepanopeziza brunnea f. sp. 'multigermtubi' TaxID=698441 RepID=UPI00239053EF|nr:hypothetical protein L3040_006854 [Drepanopeziza brunnea f. sp. 'multigermtubi']
MSHPQSAAKKKGGKQESKRSWLRRHVDRLFRAPPQERKPKSPAPTPEVSGGLGPGPSQQRRGVAVDKEPSGVTRRPSEMPTATKTPVGQRANPPEPQPVARNATFAAAHLADDPVPPRQVVSRRGPRTLHQLGRPPVLSDAGSSEPGADGRGRSSPEDGSGEEPRTASVAVWCVDDGGSSSFSGGGGGVDDGENTAAAVCVAPVFTATTQEMVAARRPVVLLLGVAVVGMVGLLRAVGGLLLLLAIGLSWLSGLMGGQGARG